MNRADVAFPARAAAAAAAPVVCILHCLAAPALLVIAPVLAENRMMELAFMSASLAVGFRLASGGVSRHGDRRIWIPVVIGALLFAGAGAGALEGNAERLGVVAGSLSILATLGWDARLRRICACRQCACPAAPADGAAP